MNTMQSSAKVGQNIYSYNKLNECPHCGTIQNSDIITQVVFDTEITDNPHLLLTSYKCNASNCSKAFFTAHIAHLSNPAYSRTSYASDIILVYPSICALPNIFDKIMQISPNAVKIYNQAMEAKLRGLDELVGIGIRKSLDHLIYDFGKKRFPDDDAMIALNENPQTMLKARINAFIENQEIKELAEACIWLGNDFTHPIRRHEATLDVLEQLARSLFYHVCMMHLAWDAKARL